MQKRLPIALLGTMLFLLQPCAASAQDYPVHAVRIIVPFAAGGSVDISTRLVATALSQELGQPVVVENRAGAGGRIGALAVAKSAPDGYMLLAGSSGSLTAMEAVARDLQYRVLRDFTPVALLNVTPMAIVVGPGSSATNYAELIAGAREKPGAIGIASAGLGTSNHLAIELLQTVAGVKFMHIPYKGSGQALTDLLSGQVPVMVDQIASSVNHARNGKLRVLAVMTSTRSSVLPDVPTLKELGVSGVEAASFTGILAPVGLPAGVLDKLQRAVLKSASKPEVILRFKELGADPRAMGPVEFLEFLKTDLERWKAVALKSSISIE
ncbi:MAG: tripartite tricarboxylate transporter substrate binding protein [Betaproteobacteria bacterium]